MDKKTSNLKLSCNSNNKAGPSTSSNSPILGNEATHSASTPLKQQLTQDDDDNYTYSPCTQELDVNVDVLWDWDSPQAKKQKRRQKRLLLTQSPKITIKRHPSNNRIQDFEKIREELQALRDKLSEPDNEHCLVLSPLEESIFKDFDHTFCADDDDNDYTAVTQKMDLTPDLFDDSLDEQMIQCSQRIENELNLPQFNVNTLPGTSNLNKLLIKGTHVENKASSFNLNNKTKDNNNTINLNVNTKKEITFADNFLEDDQMNVLTQAIDMDNTFEILPYQNSKGSQKSSGKFEFHRTQNFQMNENPESEVPLTKSVLEEIERKRKEALAKLEAKRKASVNTTSTVNLPSLKCTPREIEQKSAVPQKSQSYQLSNVQSEILLPKSILDEIEKKRKEALAKLEAKNKAKQAVKSPLFKCAPREMEQKGLQSLTKLVNVDESSPTVPQKQCKGLQTSSGKFELHRTQSFELANAQSETLLPKSTFDEIERKRKEALAKLEAKNKAKEAANSPPFKCSPVEIEQKRLQALAKLEAKRQQDIIERKRQEALKKLELNRKKNGTVIKRL